MPVETRRSCKKRKITMAEHNHGTNIHVVTPATFKSFPREVIAWIALFGDRADINSLRLTNKKCKEVVDDPRLVVKPWPIPCPFRNMIVDGPSCLLYFILFSHDGSRVAVGRRFRTSSTVQSRGGREWRSTVHVTVWDHLQGSIGEVEFQVPAFKPAFSPNGEFLVLQNLSVERLEEGSAVGIRVCRLPTAANGLGQVAVSNHDLMGVSSVAFTDNDTIIFTDGDRNATIKKCQIIGDSNGRITLSEMETVLSNEDAPDRFRSAVAYSGDRKDIVAFTSLSLSASTLHFYDIKRGALINRNMHSGGVNRLSYVYDIAFSDNGNYLVVSSSGGISVFDCDVNLIEDIRRQLRIIPGDDGGHCSCISFFPHSTMIAAKNAPAHQARRNDFPGFRVIDTENGEVTSEGWNDSSWELFVRCAQKAQQPLALQY